MAPQYSDANVQQKKEINKAKQSSKHTSHSWDGDEDMNGAVSSSGKFTSNASSSKHTNFSQPQP